MSQPESAIRAAVLRMAVDRGAKTFCPSEVARALSANWRPLMPLIRAEAQDLVNAGKLCCTQKGQPVSPLNARDPIRLSQVKARL